jgi:hypothetical protein
MSQKTYDPAQLLFSFAGIPVTGYAKDTFIEVEYEADAFSDEVGAAGEVVRVKNNDERGTVTVTLMADSQTNDLFSAVAAADRVSGTGVAPLLGKEFNGTTAFSSANAWVKKMPKVERGTEAPTVQWVFRCAKLKVFVGGLL